MYMNEKVIQKVISEFSYKIMVLIKKNNSIDNLQEFIKDEYRNCCYLDYSQLYSILLSVVFELFNQDQIRYLLKYSIPKLFNKKDMINWQKGIEDCSINYYDLCEMLITEIELLQVRKKISNKYTDFFLINLNDVVLSMDEYDNYSRKVKNKSK